MDEVLTVAKAMGWVKGSPTLMGTRFYSQKKYPSWTIDAYEIEAMLNIPLVDVPRELVAPDVNEWFAMRNPGYLRDEEQSARYFEGVVAPVLRWRLTNGK